ncbi:MAG: UDP-N-acetylmuramoyl-L-alanine--D-glutamate ligase [Parvularculaceae bacterium]
MIRIPGIEKQKIAVYGLGATGLAACEALVASGAEVFSWDEAPSARAKTKNTKFAAGQPKDWPWDELASLVLSPGVPLTHPKPHVIVRKARQERVEIVGDVELFARAVRGFEATGRATPNGKAPARPRGVAITGSNGKSTTTALVGHVLKEAGKRVHVGGNIGLPILALPELTADTTYVLELSSFQLDLAKTFRPDVAVLLNVTPDHLDRHGDFARYVAAKKRIFRARRPGDLAIVGVDDEPWQSICAELRLAGRDVDFDGRAALWGGDVAPVSARGALGRGVFALGGRIFYRLGDASGEAGDVSGVAALRGPHNGQNAAAALAAAMWEGVAPVGAARAMTRFPGLPHRMETMGPRGGVLYVNDSKATNVEAAANALAAYKNVYWIAGGRAKEGGFASLKPLMREVRGAYLIGEAAREIESDLAGATPCFQCGDLDAAFARARRDAESAGEPGPVVVLSPACASQDQYKNFEERGAAFKKLVSAVNAADGEAA